MTTTARTRTLRTAVVGLAVAATVAGGAGVAIAAPDAPKTPDTTATAPTPGTYTKEFVGRYAPTPDIAVIVAQVNLYLFNSVRINGDQACVPQPKPVVKPDTVGWKATLKATCTGDAGTASSDDPIEQK
ncbi:hypothetical protein [Williamsia sp. CHRR-6]|uniref:hypothetical protein n=1 Tax=Williamsia sp. CHRR-6 TaxID=2835871 RepID=UPI001BDAB33F|nr:hypothetical protein [Williamsia sp. CHRR-6]MBT0567596.1 hypothetical protein [Williamsia sp. CHRR-6]